MSALGTCKRPASSVFECDCPSPVPAPKRARLRSPAAVSTPPSVTQDQDQPAACDLGPGSGSEWVKLIVRELTRASSVDEAEAIVAEAARSVQRENEATREQVRRLEGENDVWKRGFKSLNGRRGEYERGRVEMEEMRQLVSQLDGQLKKLQMENCHLKLRLVREQQSNPMPDRFHPDIF